MTFPSVPIGDQFSHPTLETSTDLHTKIDTPLNQLATYLTTYQVSAPRFRAALRTPVAIGAGAVVPWDTVVYDTVGGYSATTKKYTIPTAWAGIWMVDAKLAQGAGTAIFNCQLRGLPTLYSANGVIEGCLSQAANYTESAIPPLPFRFAGGEVIYVGAAGAALATTQNPTATQDTVWWTMTWIQP